LSTAWYLRQDGHEVTVLERGDLLDNCSFGNMGYLSPSHIVPLAAPGMIEQGITWMFNPKSPFYVRPAWSADLFRWGIRFMRSCSRGHVHRSVRPLADILLDSKRGFEAWAASGLFDFELESKGCIMYYQTAKKEREEMEAARLATDCGLTVEMIDRERAHKLEPDLLPEVKGGVWFRDDAHLNPNALMQQLPSVLRSKGVEIRLNTRVIGFDSGKGNIHGVHTLSQDTVRETHEADIVVLAAGSWSPEIVKLLDISLPLMPGKGYSMTIERPNRRLVHPCILLEAKVALTPFSNQLRIGSTMEIGRMNDSILLPRVQGIVEAVPRFLPGYRDEPVFQALFHAVQRGSVTREQWGSPVDGPKVWFGYRPVSADGLPYIGFSRRMKNLVVATGHAMLGLSMGPGTGMLVANMVAGRPAPYPVSAFDPNRFS
jgi:D-amino-acid dehydrogenase